MDDFNQGNYNQAPPTQDRYQNYSPVVLPAEPSKWIKFMGIIEIISGALACLSIIGAAVGIPMIFAGIRATKGYENALKYAQTNNQNEYNQSMEHLNMYFKIKGIITIVGISLSILYFIILLLIFGIAFWGAGSYSRFQ